MRLQPVLATWLGLSLALPAAAQDHPRFQPTRDVMVEYHVTGGAPGEHRSDTVRMYFTDGGMKIRIEPVGQPAYSIVDRNAQRMVMVMAPQHIYMEMMYDPTRVMTFDDSGATFKHAGSDTVAGIGCEVYDVQRQGRNGEVCISSDGVLLRAKSDDPAQPGRGLVATTVAYGPQPASLFVPPAGFQKMDVPHGMPGGPPTR